MINLLKAHEDILKVQIGINLILLVVSFFYSSKGLLISMALLNLILCGVSLLLKKYEPLFAFAIKTNSFVKKLNSAVDKLN